MTSTPAFPASRPRTIDHASRTPTMAEGTTQAIVARSSRPAHEKPRPRARPTAQNGSSALPRNPRTRSAERCRRHPISLRGPRVRLRGSRVPQGGAERPACHPISAPGRAQRSLKDGATTACFGLRPVLVSRHGGIRQGSRDAAPGPRSALGDDDRGRDLPGPGWHDARRRRDPRRSSRTWRRSTCWPCSPSACSTGRCRPWPPRWPPSCSTTSSSSRPSSRSRSPARTSGSTSCSCSPSPSSSAGSPRCRRSAPRRRRTARSRRRRCTGSPGSSPRPGPSQRPRPWSWRVSPRPPPWIEPGSGSGPRRPRSGSSPTPPAGEPLPMPGWHVVLQRPPDGPARWVRTHVGRVGPRRSAKVVVHRVRVEVAGETLGSLWALRARSEREPDRAETRILAAAADQLGQAVVRDRLTEEATNAEILRESESLKSALLNSVSHDLRTPLATIRAAAGSMLDRSIGWSQEEQLEAFETIDAEAERMGRLVRNLLDLSRIEGGALKPELAAHDAGEIARLAAARIHAEGKTIRHRHPGTPPAGPVDDVYLGQILTNLLENAVRYGGSTIVVEGRDLADEGAVELSGRGRRRRRAGPRAGAPVRQVLPGAEDRRSLPSRHGNRTDRRGRARARDGRHGPRGARRERAASRSWSSCAPRNCPHDGPRTSADPVPVGGSPMTASGAWLLVVEDEEPTRRLLRGVPCAPRLPRGRGCLRAGGDAGVGGPPAGPHPPGPGAAGPRRRRCDPPHPPRCGDADHRAVGPRRGAGQDRRARGRRGRLSLQAVLGGRAGGAHPRRAAPRRRPGRRDRTAGCGSGRSSSIRSVGA